MSLPKYPGKHDLPSLFSARDVAGMSRDRGKWEAPDGFILCYQGELFDYAVRRYRGKSIGIPFGQARILRPKKGVEVGIAGHFGIGAPVAVFILEWLAALGVRRFLSIGAAGGLLETQEAGDIVIPSRALRDEGTSYHYLPPADYSLPDEKLAARLSAALTSVGCAHENGGTWTTDAPLRETMAEVERCREAGIQTVEMEAAALFAAAQYLGAACAAGLTIADSIREGRWQVEYDRTARTAGLQALADAAVKVLS